MKNKLVIGGAGFIGSQLVKKLLVSSKVTVIDNLSRGSTDYIDAFMELENFKFLQFDVSNQHQCKSAFSEAIDFAEIDEVWHLAANSDIPAGVNDSSVDLKDTFLTTFEILNCMKFHKIKVIHFASSSAIYGDCMNSKISEKTGPLLPISNYGAMKLASEAQISAAAEHFLDRANIFRFPNVIGTPATHGVIFDFINRLILNKNELTVLGNGTQQKSYLHVKELIDAMLFIKEKDTDAKIEVFNIGPEDDGVTVKFIAENVVKRVSPNARIIFGEGNKGWIGDVPKFRYSVDKLKKIGWKPEWSSKKAVLNSIDEIANQLLTNHY
jgi:UDP-glucose 4-epimerase